MLSRRRHQRGELAQEFHRGEQQHRAPVVHGALHRVTDAPVVRQRQPVARERAARSVAAQVFEADTAFARERDCSSSENARPLPRRVRALRKACGRPWKDGRTAMQACNCAGKCFALGYKDVDRRNKSVQRHDKTFDRRNKTFACRGKPANAAHDRPGKAAATARGKAGARGRLAGALKAGRQHPRHVATTAAPAPACRPRAHAVTARGNE